MCAPQSLRNKHPTGFKSLVNLYGTRAGRGIWEKRLHWVCIPGNLVFSLSNWKGDQTVFLPGLINLHENKYFSSTTTTARPRTGRLLYVLVWLVEKFKHLHQKDKKNPLLESSKRREGGSFHYIRQTSKVAKNSGCRWLLTSRQELDESDFEECCNIRQDNKERIPTADSLSDTLQQPLISWDHFVTARRGCGSSLPDTQVLQASLAPSITTKSFWEFTTKAFTGVTAMKKNLTASHPLQEMHHWAPPNFHRPSFKLWEGQKRQKRKAGARQLGILCTPSTSPSSGQTVIQKQLYCRIYQRTKRRRWQTCNYCPWGRAKGREIHMDTGEKFISTYRVQVNAAGIFTSSS